MPRADYDDRRQLDVHGLRASGSHDIVVKTPSCPHTAPCHSQLLERKETRASASTPAAVQTLFSSFPRATSVPIAVGPLKGMADQVIQYAWERSKTVVARAGVGNTAQDPARGAGLGTGTLGR